MKDDLNLVSLSLSQEEKFRPGRGSISHLTAVAILAPLSSSKIRRSGQTVSISMVGNRSGHNGSHMDLGLRLSSSDCLMFLHLQKDNTSQDCMEKYKYIIH